MDGSRAYLTELRRRKVLRSALIYAGSAWVALQVAGLALPGLGLPGEAIRYVWIGAFAGLPLALLFAWRYQITARGVVRTAPAAEADDTLPLRRPDYLLLGTLAVVAGGICLHLADRIRDLPATAARAGLPGEIAPNSLAVLPLENVTGDPEQEPFVAGLHDALITDLGKIGSLVVKAASSSRVYANVVQPVRQTARELGAAHLIEGSVFRTEDRVRVNVRLVASGTEETLWTESYERPVQDVLTLQGEVARAVAEQIQVELTPEEERRLTAPRPVDPEVYETYVRGMYHLNRYTPEGLERGLGYLREAVELDPEDPLAYAGLAQGYTLIGHSAHPPPGVYARARDAALRALELDPLFPEAHAALAEIRLYFDWDWEAAGRSFRRALQLNPSLEWAHGHYAWYLQLTGDMEGALEHMRRARQIAPVTPIFSAWLAWLHWADGTYDRAIAEAQRALDIDPAFHWALHVLGGTYTAAGMHEEAVATLERLRAVHPTLARWGFGTYYATTGQRAEAEREMAALAEDPGQKDLLTLGVVHAMLGHRGEALDWFEAAHEEPVDWFPWVVAPSTPDPFTAAAVDTLRDEPRFRRLVEALGVATRHVAEIPPTVDRHPKPR